MNPFSSLEQLWFFSHEEETVGHIQVEVLIDGKKAFDAFSSRLEVS